ncbi:DinB family protein [Desulfovibrio sp. OttesenSCG-928-I05]|nr:DinB family protein [Desulfovibrio sp. OttesenSCG-928-I05]
MSRSVVTSLQGAFARSLGMTRQFIEACPDNIWEKKFGGWPIWQQVYHSIAVLDLFALDKDEQPSQNMFSNDIFLLKECGDMPPTKKQLLELADTMEAVCNKLIDSLDDSMLANEQRGLSAKLGMPFNMAMALSMMNSHTMYHLGCCDAALREHGLKGIF